MLLVLLQAQAPCTLVPRVPSQELEELICVHLQQPPLSILGAPFWGVLQWLPQADV